MSLPFACSEKCIFLSKIGQALGTWVAEFNCQSPYLSAFSWIVDEVQEKVQSPLGGSYCVWDKEGPTAAVFYQQNLGRCAVWPQNKKSGSEAAFHYLFSNILNGTWPRKGGALGLAFYTRVHIPSGYPEAWFSASSLHTGAKFIIQCQIAFQDA